jgi:hypothetical protein
LTANTAPGLLPALGLCTEERRRCVTKVLHEDKLLTPCSSYATLEQIEACLMGERSIVRPGLIWIEILRPDRSGLRMIERMIEPA